MSDVLGAMLHAPDVQVVRQGAATLKQVLCALLRHTHFSYSGGDDSLLKCKVRRFDCALQFLYITIRVSSITN